MKLIVGAGITGCTIAEHISRFSNEEVLLIDKRSHIAGNIYDEKIENIWIHRYGPHIFHTNDKNVWDYINRFGSFYPYIHKVRAIIDGIEVPLPFSLLSMEKLFPENMYQSYVQELEKHFVYGSRINIFELAEIPTLQPLASFIYEKIFKNYSTKQWGSSLEFQELDPSVAKRLPFIFGKADCYFDDQFQGIPIEGYSTLCKNMIDHPKIKLELNTSHKKLDLSKFSQIFYCGGIDEFFDYRFGELQYRGIRFDFSTLQTEKFQNNSVINYPNNYAFTRITEYKHFLPITQSNKTIISMEYPLDYQKGQSEQCYPIPHNNQRKLYQQYAEYAKKYPNLYFCGRLGMYQYLDMDDAILEASKLCAKLFDKAK